MPSPTLREQPYEAPRGASSPPAAAPTAPAPATATSTAATTPTAAAHEHAHRHHPDHDDNEDIATTPESRSQQRETDGMEDQHAGDQRHRGSLIRLQAYRCAARC